MRISDILSGYATSHDCRFTLAGVEVPASELFSDLLMLPVVTVHAQAKSLRLLGSGLGCMVREDKSGLLSVRAEVPEVSFGRVSDLVRALFFINAAEFIFGVARGGVIDCTPVLEFFSKPLSERFDLTKQTVEVIWPLAQPAQLR